MIARAMSQQVEDPVTPKHVRERWNNHLNPELNKQPWVKSEDAQLLALAEKHGPAFSRISKELYGRSEHMVKNRYYRLRKQAQAEFKHTSLEDAIKLLRAKLEIRCASDSKPTEPTDDI
jgi:hypothetical protein